MAERPDFLPDFDNPPVVEVVLGVQFDRIQDFRQGHFGRFWDIVQDRYPLTQDHPRLESPFFMPDEGAPQPWFKVQMVGSLPTHRAWFMSSDEERLIQLQDDRLIHNWRYRGRTYPRFESLRDEFWALLGAFRSTLEGSEIQPPSLRQVEVTYLNWISNSSPERFLRAATDAALNVDGVSSRPDFQTWQSRYSVVTTERPGHAYLTIESKPGSQRTDTGIETGYILSLTYSSQLGDGTDDAAVDSEFLRSRQLIVEAFTEITRAEMHRDTEWRRTK